MFAFTRIDSAAYSTISPTWISSPLFRAGNQRLIFTKTQASTSTYPVPFLTALPSIPNFAYGLKTYAGNTIYLHRL